MILRRVIEHFRKQEWTAIAIDFVIVVLGVFVGLQVSNWNAARQQSSLAEAYKARISVDLSTMETYLEGILAETSGRYDLSVDLLRAASRASGGEDILVSAAQAFFTKGWKTPRFTITDAAYKDLMSTGNLNLIEPGLRQKITSYYADLDRRKERIAIGRDWSLPNDSRFIMEHDVYRWDLSLAELAEAGDQAIRRETIIGARSDLARLASMSVYIEKASLDDYIGALASTRMLAAALAGGRETAP